MKTLATPLLVLLLLSGLGGLPGPVPPSPDPADGAHARPGPDAPLPRESPPSLAAARDALTAYRGEDPRLALWYPSPDGLPAGFPSPSPVPQDSDQRQIHGADGAQALGFTGAGVRVAVADTGLDFAQPELAGRQARISNATSDYHLHPIAYDPTSLNDYLLDGVIDADRSWFVDTGFEAAVWFSDGEALVSYEEGSVNRTWTVTGLKTWTAGEAVRIGFHPDQKLEEIYGRKAGLLLYGSKAGGPWDRVVADLDDDGDFGDEKVAYLNAASPVDDRAELLYQDVTGDGVADLSGGMVYFIADGVRELPYAAHQIETVNRVWRTLLNDESLDVWAERGATPEDHLVPANGSLVTLFGDFGPPGAFGAHGTWVTSALAGQGAVDRGSEGPNLTGMAPGVEILAAGNLWGGDPLGLPWQFALVFAAEGYDGAPGTGDEAHLASNSWGSTGFGGWAWSCRFADYVSTALAQNRTLYLFAGGNSGWGYGALQCPAGAASTVAVGASTNFHYRDDPWFAFDGGPHPAFGNVASFSERGPSALGTQFVDVLADGLFGYGAEPLNHHLVQTGSADGVDAWLLWAGTSLSTPVAAGAAALLYEAYNETHGAFPDAETGKTLLKASARDVGNDPFLQGAGLVDALRAVELASGRGGVQPSAHELRPGASRGDLFPRVLGPGETNATDLTLRNVGPEDVQVTAETATLALGESVSHRFAVDVLNPSAEFILNETGLYALNGTALVTWSPATFRNAHALRVSAFVPQSRMDLAATYLLEVMDWTDTDGDGVFDGVPERNRMNFDVVLSGRDQGPLGQVFVERPAEEEEVHDGLYVWFRALDPGALLVMRPTLQVDFLSREPFPWIAITPGGVTVPAGGSATLRVDTAVPPTASPGVYQTALRLLWEDNVTTVPLTVTVAAPDVPFSLEDGFALATYDNDVLYGAATKNVFGSGDARYVFVDLAEDPGGPVTLAVDLPGPATWAEAYALAPAEDWFSTRLPDRFGPHGLVTVAVNGVPAREGIALRANLTAGLNLLVVRSLFVSGEGVGDAFGARVLRADLAPEAFAREGAPTPGTLDLEVAVNAGLEELVAGGRGFSRPLRVSDEPIATGTVDEYPFTVADGGYIRAVTEGPPDLDVDLVLWYQHPVLDWMVTTVSASPGPHERVFTTLPRDGDYRLWVVGFSVPSGAGYNLTLEVVQGQSVEAEEAPDSLAPGEVGDLTVAYELPLVTATWQGVVLVGTPENPDLAFAFLEMVPDRPPVFANPQVPPGSVVNESAPVLGVEMADAVDPFTTAVDPASVRILVDGLDMTAAAEVNATAVRLEVPVLLLDGEHTVRVEASDLGGSRGSIGWSFVVDTVAPFLRLEPVPAATNASGLVLEGQVEAGANLTLDGEPVAVNATGHFAVERTLPEGTHRFVLRAVDRAGNQAVETATVRVDRTAPAIRLDAPRDGEETGQPLLLLRGETEPGARLTVNNRSVAVDTEGGFATEVTLEAGENVLRLEATDPAGNAAETTVRVTYVPPEARFRDALLVGLGILGTVAVGAAALFLLRRRGRRGGS